MSFRENTFYPVYLGILAAIHGGATGKIESRTEHHLDPGLNDKFMELSCYQSFFLSSMLCK